jgi:hypothetical protein
MKMAVVLFTSESEFGLSTIDKELIITVAISIMFPLLNNNTDPFKQIYHTCHLEMNLKYEHFFVAK